MGIKAPIITISLPDRLEQTRQWERIIGPLFKWLTITLFCTYLAPSQTSSHQSYLWINPELGVLRWPLWVSSLLRSLAMTIAMLVHSLDEGPRPQVKRLLRGPPPRAIQHHQHNFQIIEREHTSDSLLIDSDSARGFFPSLRENSNDSRWLLFSFHSRSIWPRLVGLNQQVKLSYVCAGILFLNI